MRALQLRFRREVLITIDTTWPGWSLPRPACRNEFGGPVSAESLLYRTRNQRQRRVQD